MSDTATPRRDVFVTMLAVAATSCLVVTSFLFGRHTADPVTVVPAPRVYLVPPTTASSVAP